MKCEFNFFGLAKVEGTPEEIFERTLAALKVNKR